MPPAPPQPPVTASAPRRRRLPLAALGLLGALAVFGWGIFHLFELRFAGGDVYPPYSTLRRDPLGAAVFHDALTTLPDLRVERNLRPLASLDLPSKLLLARADAPNEHTDRAPGALLFFYLGADAYEWPYIFRHNAFERLDAILRQGGRVVLTFLPSQTPLTEKRLEKLREDQSGEPEGSPSTKGSPSPKDSPKRQPPEAIRLEDLSARWDIDFRRIDKVPAKGASSHASPSPAPRNEPTDARPVPGGPLDGAGTVSWHSVLDFDLDAPEPRAAGWRALYQRGTRPVIVARPVGDRGGELILASDSYFLSNEALRAEERPALLAGLIGPARRVIFDETHLGIAEQPGMMTLARRYGLQGGLAALALLAVLFIWRNVVSLVPPPVPLAGQASTNAGSIAGRDAAAGFLNLLRRGVAPRELIVVCLEQWQHMPGGRTPDTATIEHLRALAAEEGARPANRRSPATVYRAMCAALRVRS